MAEKIRYPQIPSTVWWGVRSILQRTPNATVDERLLSVQLGVQEAASRAYISELTAVGILTEDGKATPLAQKWRLDETYLEAITELTSAVYPEGLSHVASAGAEDRQKIVAWFLREGLGQGAAGNKAATYLMLSSPTPNDAPPRGGGGRSTKEERVKRGAPRAIAANRVLKSVQDPASVRQELTEGARTQIRSPEAFPLNVNVQIHISADAGSEQIESIFLAMRRYLYDTASS
jgi:hypothetical protein